MTLDPDRLPETGPQRVPIRRAFSSSNCRLRLNALTRSWASLIPVGEDRARIYGRDGSLIVDSNQRLSRGQLMRPSRRRQRRSRRPEKLKSGWTRLTAFITAATCRSTGHRQRQRHDLPRSRKRARWQCHAHAAAQRGGRADRGDGSPDHASRRRAGRGPAVLASRRHRQILTGERLVTARACR